MGCQISGGKLGVKFLEKSVVSNFYKKKWGVKFLENVGCQISRKKHYVTLEWAP